MNIVEKSLGKEGRMPEEKRHISCSVQARGGKDGTKGNCGLNGEQGRARKATPKRNGDFVSKDSSSSPSLLKPVSLTQNRDRSSQEGTQACLQLLGQSYPVRFTRCLAWEGK